MKSTINLTINIEKITKIQKNKQKTKLQKNIYKILNYKKTYKTIKIQKHLLTEEKQPRKDAKVLPLKKNHSRII